MFGISLSLRRLDAIKSRLVELGAKISTDKDTGEIIVRMDEGCVRRSQELEFGFLMGQWAALEGIEFPRDFPKNIMHLGNRLRVDADPGGLRFEFYSRYSV